MFDAFNERQTKKRVITLRTVLILPPLPYLILTRTRITVGDYGFRIPRAHHYVRFDVPTPLPRQRIRTGDPGNPMFSRNARSMYRR
jgi:hypothetical protein